MKISLSGTRRQDTTNLWSPSWDMQMPILHQSLHSYRDIRNLILFAFDLAHAAWRKGRCEAIMCKNDDKTG